MLQNEKIDTVRAHFAPVLDLLNSRYLTPIQLAARWKWTEQHLANLRRAGKGPAFTRLQRSVRYALSDVLAWELAGASPHVTPDRLALAAASLQGFTPEQREAIARQLSALLFKEA